MLKNLWMDESGGLICAELVIVMTLLMCSTIVGISALRDAIVTELADVAAAIAALNQSYSVGGISGYHAYQPGSQFIDGRDQGDDGNTQAGPNSRGIVICTTEAPGEAPH